VVSHKEWHKSKCNSKKKKERKKKKRTAGDKRQKRNRTEFLEILISFIRLVFHLFFPIDALVDNVLLSLLPKTFSRHKDSSLTEMNENTKKK